MPAKQRRTFYPTHLSTYEKCPERYFHQYVEKRPIPFGFVDLSLERGRAIHRVLYDVALGFMEHEPLPTDILKRAAVALKRAPYGSDDNWREDFEIVIRDIEFGLGLFDGTAQVLVAEREYFRAFPESNQAPFFVLAAKVDLVLRRVDDDGLVFLDVVDFKSGVGIANPVQEFICQTVVEHNAVRLRAPHNYIRSATVRTGVGEVEAWEIEDQELDYLKQHVEHLVKTILMETKWLPVESPRCDWCPYQKGGCSVFGAKG
jgi:hypothetical protein